MTSFNLVWGIERGERDARQDCLALRFVSADPRGDPAAQELEAWEPFELIRAVTELWGFKSASIVALPSVEWKGCYEVFNFTRGPDGQSWMARVADQVFGTKGVSSASKDALQRRPRARRG